MSTDVSSDATGAWQRGFPLAFEAEQERAYGQWLNRRLMSVRQVATLVGTAIWCLFLVWDYALAQADPSYAAVMPWIVGLRVFVAFGMLVAHTWFISSKRVLTEPGYGDSVIMWTAVFVYLGLAVIVGVMPPPYDRLYGFTGLALVSAFTFGLYGLSARAAMRLAACQALTLCAVVGWCATQKPAVMPTAVTQQFPVSALLLLGLFIGVGCMVCWLFELISRRSFLDQQALAVQNEEIRSHGLEVQRLHDALAMSSAEAQERLQAVIRLKERLHQEAEARNRERSQFMASAVHDLRQPVQAILAAMYPVSRALERGDQEAVSHLLQLSHQATHFLQDQLTGMLEIARLESGRVQPDLAWVDLRKLAQEMIRAFSAQAQSDGVRLNLELPAEACWVRSDAQFLRRILGNLISNGIKYRRADAPDGAWVSVNLRSGGGQARVQVLDNGLGIAEDLLAQGLIFQPFFQANNLLAQTEKGVGLGLAVVQKLLALLDNHDLSVKSELGAGTCFELSLPKMAQELEPATMRLPADVDLQVLSGLYVLLVEDDVIVRESMQHMLHVVGVRCEPFADYEALAAAAEDIERIPDVLISDYRLPAGRTALDVLRLQRTVWPEVPLIVLSGEPLDVQTQPELNGVTLYRKPASVEDLLRALVTLSRQAPRLIAQP